MLFGRHRRPAAEGELCLCGHQAVVVLDDPRLGPEFGSCLAQYEHPRFGPCPFCFQAVSHAVGSDCPGYVLRPAWNTGSARAALAERVPSELPGWGEAA